MTELTGITGIVLILIGVFGFYIYTPIGMIGFAILATIGNAMLFYSLVKLVINRKIDML